MNDELDSLEESTYKFMRFIIVIIVFGSFVIAIGLHSEANPRLTVEPTKAVNPCYDRHGTPQDHMRCENRMKGIVK